MYNIDWDDLRYVLAVADDGTVSGAATLLGVTHVTVLRRVSAFEERYGVQIFDRSARGYTVRKEYLVFMEKAREIRSSIESLESQFRSSSGIGTRTVQVVSTDVYCQYVLPDIIKRFHSIQDKIRVSLVASNDRRDACWANADLTIQPNYELSQGLSGRKAALCGFHVFARPDAPAEWLGPVGALTQSVTMQWLEEIATGQEIVGYADSFVSLGRMVEAGLGRAILPAAIGSSLKGVEILSEFDPFDTIPIWVSRKTGTENATRISGVAAFLESELQTMSAVLSGRAE